MFIWLLGTCSNRSLFLVWLFIFCHALCKNWPRQNVVRYFHFIRCLSLDSHTVDIYNIPNTYIIYTSTTFFIFLFSALTNIFYGCLRCQTNSAECYNTIFASFFSNIYCLEMSYANLLFIVHGICLRNASLSLSRYCFLWHSS